MISLLSLQWSTRLHSVQCRCFSLNRPGLPSCPPLSSWLHAAALCVFNTVTLLLRGALTRSGRSGSSTSRAGPTTAFPTMPQACWASSGESSPKLWPTRGPWWSTAGQSHKVTVSRTCNFQPLKVFFFFFPPVVLTGAAALVG